MSQARRASCESKALKAVQSRNTNTDRLGKLRPRGRIDGYRLRRQNHSPPTIRDTRSSEELRRAAGKTRQAVKPEGYECRYHKLPSVKMGRPEDGAWTNTGSVRPPVGRLVGAGGHRIEAYRQLSVIDRRQPYWTSNPACGYVYFSCGVYLSQISRAQWSRSEYRGHYQTGFSSRCYIYIVPST